MNKKISRIPKKGGKVLNIDELLHKQNKKEKDELEIA